MSQELTAEERHYSVSWLPSLSSCSSTRSPSTPLSEEANRPKPAFKGIDHMSTRKTVGVTEERRLTPFPCSSPFCPSMGGLMALEKHTGCQGLVPQSTSPLVGGRTACSRPALPCPVKPWPGLPLPFCNHHLYCDCAMAFQRKYSITTMKIRKPIQTLLSFFLACFSLTVSPKRQSLTLNEKLVLLRFTVLFSSRLFYFSISSCFQTSMN